MSKPTLGELLRALLGKMSPGPRWRVLNYGSREVVDGEGNPVCTIYRSDCSDADAQGVAALPAIIEYVVATDDFAEALDCDNPTTDLRHARSAALAKLREALSDE